MTGRSSPTHSSNSVTTKVSIPLDTHSCGVNAKAIHGVAQVGGLLRDYVITHSVRGNVRTVLMAILCVAKASMYTVSGYHGDGALYNKIKLVLSGRYLLG